MNKIVWFRYDLRLLHNDAFLNAIKNGNILPIFIFDKMKADRKKLILSEAEKFIKQNTA